MEGVDSRAAPGPRLALGVNPQLAGGAIQLPQLSSPRWGPPKSATERLVKALPDFSMPTSRGGYPLPVTSSERRLPVYGRAPECVVIVVASGQLSTDSVGADGL